MINQLKQQTPTLDMVSDEEKASWTTQLVQLEEAASLMMGAPSSSSGNKLKGQMALSGHLPIRLVNKEGEGLCSKVMGASSVGNGLLLSSTGGLPVDGDDGNSVLGSSLPHDSTVPFVRWATSNGGHGSGAYVPIVSMDWSGPWLQAARDGALDLPPAFTRHPPTRCIYSLSAHPMTFQFSRRPSFPFTSNPCICPSSLSSFVLFFYRHASAVAAGVTTLSSSSTLPKQPLAGGYAGMFSRLGMPTVTLDQVARHKDYHRLPSILFVTLFFKRSLNYIIIMSSLFELYLLLLSTSVWRSTPKPRPLTVKMRGTAAAARNTAVRSKRHTFGVLGDLTPYDLHQVESITYTL